MNCFFCFILLFFRRKFGTLGSKYPPPPKKKRPRIWRDKYSHTQFVNGDDTVPHQTTRATDQDTSHPLRKHGVNLFPTLELTCGGADFELEPARISEAR